MSARGNSVRCLVGCGTTASIGVVHVRPTVSKTIPARNTTNAEYMAKKSDAIEDDRTMAKAITNAMFVLQPANGHQVLAYIPGRVHQHHTRLLPEDRVMVELSPYYLTRGRIVYRYKSSPLISAYTMS